MKTLASSPEGRDMPESLGMTSFFSDSLDRECVREYFLLQVKYKSHTPQQSCFYETFANGFFLLESAAAPEEDAYHQVEVLDCWCFALM